MYIKQLYYFFFLDTYQTCSEEVLQYIVQNIGDDWYQFLTNLTNSKNRLEKHLPMIQEMRTNGKNGEENTRQFLFNDNTQLLKWSEVKSALQLLSKDGISMANFLETKTLYNKGKSIRISFVCNNCQVFSHRMKGLSI